MNCRVRQRTILACDVMKWNIYVFWANCFNSRFVSVRLDDSDINSVKLKFLSSECLIFPSATVPEALRKFGQLIYFLQIAFQSFCKFRLIRLLIFNIQFLAFIIAEFGVDGWHWQQIAIELCGRFSIGRKVIFIINTSTNRQRNEAVRFIAQTNQKIQIIYSFRQINCRKITLPLDDNFMNLRINFSDAT